MNSILSSLGINPFYLLMVIILFILQIVLIVLLILLYNKYNNCLLYTSDAADEL